MRGRYRIGDVYALLPSFGGRRRTAQSTSGRSSSHVTRPSVAFSIAGQRSAGTFRRFNAHWEINIRGTTNARANSERMPRRVFT